MTTDAPGGWAAYLDPDERLLWEGEPSTRPTAGLPDVGLVVLGLVLVWYATPPVLWPDSLALVIDGAPAEPRSTEARLTVWGMLLVGLHLAFGRGALGYLRRRATRYALTDRRALIATRFPGRRLRSHPIMTDTPVEFEPGDRATIVFVSDAGPDGERDGMRDAIAFERIADGEKVLALVRAIQGGDLARIRGETA